MTALEKRVLITGAAGEIGSTLRSGLRGRYALLRLADIRSLGAPAAREEIVRADLRDYDAMRSALQDIDCVVHLGGIPRENTWDAILDSNIVGTYNVFEAFAPRFAASTVDGRIPQSSVMAGRSARSSSMASCVASIERFLHSECWGRASACRARIRGTQRC